MKCSRMLEQVIERLLHINVDADDVEVRYQEFEKDKGILDLEITDNQLRQSGDGIFQGSHS